MAALSINCAARSPSGPSSKSSNVRLVCFVNRILKPKSNSFSSSSSSELFWKQMENFVEGGIFSNVKSPSCNPGGASYKDWPFSKLATLTANSYVSTSSCNTSNDPLFCFGLI